MERHIPIAKPVITGDELSAIGDVLRSGMLAQGRAVEEFERGFSEYIGAANAIAVSNGTVALDLALKAHGIGQGDEVITTPFTFIATANSILYQGAKPVFADVDEKTFNIRPEAVLEKITGKTKAVIGVHLFGHPFDVPALEEICGDHDIILIEDCAQAHGAEYRGKKAGSSGTGCFSFYPTKNITTGEGGMITSGSANITEQCRLLRNHGQSSKYYHTVLGYNFRMTDIQAAIGLVQLKNLEEFNRKRIRNAAFLNSHIRIDGLVLPSKEPDARHVYHQYVVITQKGCIDRDRFMKYLTANGIGCAVHYPLPIYMQPLYRGLGHTKEGAGCPVADGLASSVLSLPVHPSLEQADLQYITDVINRYEEA